MVGASCTIPVWDLGRRFLARGVGAPLKIARFFFSSFCLISRSVFGTLCEYLKRSNGMPGPPLGCPNSPLPPSLLGIAMMRMAAALRVASGQTPPPVANASSKDYNLSE